MDIDDDDGGEGGNASTPNQDVTAAELLAQPPFIITIYATAAELGACARGYNGTEAEHQEVSLLAQVIYDYV